MISAVITGVLGLGLAVVSAWLAVKGRDGSGWALVAFCLIVTSCSRAEGL